jgi:VanZ family protein
MAGIFYLSHTPGDNLPSSIAGMDKICHAGAYGVLAFTCIFALQPSIAGKSFLAPGIGIILFCFLYGVSDEFHQSFIPGRSPEWQDLVADAVGSTLVVLVWWLLLRRSRRKPPIAV